MKRILVGAAALSITLLVGCSEGTIMYENKERSVEEVEEIIADKLEVENPSEDLEVDIYAEQED
jgi:outer membrane murein-binding lipoprotein Lpp